MVSSWVHRSSPGKEIFAALPLLEALSSRLYGAYSADCDRNPFAPTPITALAPPAADLEGVRMDGESRFGKRVASTEGGIRTWLGIISESKEGGAKLFGLSFLILFSLQSKYESTYSRPKRREVSTFDKSMY